MTSKFVFIGDRAEILSTPHVFTSFGQTVDLDVAAADDLIVNQNFPILPADKFAATEGAADRPLAARIALHQYREALREVLPEQEQTK